MRHVIFRLDRDRYALPLSTVREVVVAPERYGRVPHAKPSVKGVMTLRGRVVLVVDLGRLLTMPGELPPGGKVVLLELSRRELGLFVTEVEGIESIEAVGNQGRASRMVNGLAKVGTKSVTVLDVDGIDAAVAASFANG